MSFKIGFLAEHSQPKPVDSVCPPPKDPVPPRKSVVQVYFKDRNRTLAYYNDQFDLHYGDLVYVDGKLEGLQGRVQQVTYNFKIKLSDYKRVIAVADPHVHGTLFMAGSHFVTFNRNVLPYEQALTWFKAPSPANDGFVSGYDDHSFVLENVSGMGASSAVLERGHDYYLRNLVRYICIDGTHGRAIVEGTKAYEVEFEYQNGTIHHLICSCFCSGGCKHEVAAMFQLRETLDLIEPHYSNQYQSSGYFAAVTKGLLFSVAVDGSQTGSIMLNC